MKSLRDRLLLFVVLAILATAMLQAALAWRTARTEADALFDYQMQQTAQTLRASLPFELGRGLLPWVQAPQQVDFVLQIWSIDGQLLLRSADRPELPLRAVLGFDEVPAHGTNYRVYAELSGGLVIQVAQDMRVRNRMAGGLALRSAAPVLWLAPLLMLAVLLLVRRSFAPVTRVQQQLAQRGAQDMQPVSELGLPSEIEPLVHEFNALLQRLNQAFDAQQRFVADAAHELRSPLAAIRLQIEALQRSPEPADRQLALQRLSAGVDRSTRLISQLLDLARQQAQAGHGTGLQALPDLVQWVRGVLADVLPMARLRGHDLGLREPTGSPASLPTVMAAPEALALLLRNLLENAIKYTPPGGRIDIVLEPGPAGQGVTLAVEDSGPGIEPDQRERVLNRFYRQPGVEPGGSGLGLSIAESVARMHGSPLLLGTSPTLGGLRAEVTLSPA
jgi:two-component system OmpR family sensor kinase